ncbi:MAG: polyamine aminopropyltransferase [Nitrospirota bacterium]
MKKKQWFIDKDSENRWICHKTKGLLLSKKTRFQKVEIFDTYAFGRMIILDGKIQSAEKDEFIYHEALVHPSMIMHLRPENILILGGGEGATLREVLKHPSVKHVFMIDIDGEFVDICRKHLETWHLNSFNDPRVKLFIADAYDFIRKTNAQYDVVIADISDPLEEGPAVRIYTERFYSMVRKVLKHDGIFVTHATNVDYPGYEGVCSRVVKALGRIFPKYAFYYEYIPSFGTLWGFAIGSLEYAPDGLSPGLVKKRLLARKLEDLSYYNPETHQRIFSLSKPVKRFLELD